VKAAFPRTDHGIRDRWMISYMDVLTILLIFFISVAGQKIPGQNSPAQQNHAPEASHTAPSTAIVSSPATHLQSIKTQLAETGMDVHMEKHGLVISIPQAVLFAPGQNALDPSALESVKKIALVLRQVPNQVNLVGYTDPTPIHNHRFNDNWELAAARGLRLLDIFVKTYGIAEERLSVTSHASNDPKASNQSAEGRAANRRVEIVVLDEAAGN
jgi:chemotaxis protein MotB